MTNAALTTSYKAARDHISFHLGIGNIHYLAKFLSSPKHELSATQLTRIIRLIGEIGKKMFTEKRQSQLKTKVMDIIPSTAARDKTLHPLNNIDIAQHIGSFLSPKDIVLFAQINLNCHEAAPFALMQSIREKLKTQQVGYTELNNYRKALHLQTFSHLFSLFHKEFSLVKKCNFAGGFELIVELLSCVATFCPNLEEIDLSNTLNIADGTSNDALILLAKGCRKITGINLSDCYDLTDESILVLNACCREMTIINVTGCPMLTERAFVVLSL